MGLHEAQLLLLIIVANGAPILGSALLKQRGAWPLDGGCCWRDGRPLLGPSKTWRGVVLALTAAGMVAWSVGLPTGIGLTAGTFVVFGDLLSSFIKRRLGMAPSSMALGLDQIPEALLPLLAVKSALHLSWLGIVETVSWFVILELLLSRILFNLHIRNRPY